MELRYLYQIFEKLQVKYSEKLLIAKEYITLINEKHTVLYQGMWTVKE